MRKALRRFFNRHFVKVKFLQSIFVIPYQFEGKKYLHISREKIEFANWQRRTGNKKNLPHRAFG